MIDGGIHPREWAAPMSVLYILRQLIDNEEVIKKLTFYIVPLVNPDGYEYTHVEDRLWRKTMSKQPDSNCVGVDVNRNFDSHWNGTKVYQNIFSIEMHQQKFQMDNHCRMLIEFGAESDACSSIYSGPCAFSESETRAIRDLIEKVKPVMYLTFHTYGGVSMIPVI